MKTQWRFSVHPVGIACLAAAILFVPIDRLLAALAAITLHEVGHLVAIGLCGVKRCAIEWTPLGFIAQADGFACLSAGRRVLIAGAGLLVSGGMAGISYPWAAEHPFAYLFFMTNLALLLINALPVLPLDGGRVLLGLAALLGWERPVRQGLVWLSYLIAFAVSALGVYSAFSGALNPTLLVLGPYLAYAVKQCNVDNSVEWVQTLEKRKKVRNGIYKAETWVAVGDPDPLSLMQMLKKTPQEKFALLQTINPVDGSAIGNITQQQILVKLMGETTNNH